MTEPITPEAATELAKKHIFPLIEAFNTLLAQRALSESIVIYGHEITAIVGDRIKLPAMVGAAKLFTNSGWNVEFDMPGYNETYKTFWRFEKKNLK